MEQRLSIITLGVDNLEAMKSFYTEKFGWSIEAQAKNIAFFKLNGLLLGLYGRKDLAAFTGQWTEGSGFRPFILSYMVASKEKVLQLYEQFLQRGIRVIKEPEQPPFGGYYFLASDIEGNVWEIALNPFMDFDDLGNVLSHQNIDNL